MANQYNKYDCLEYYELIQEKSDLMPIVDNDVSSHRKLKTLCLQEGPRHQHNDKFGGQSNKTFRYKEKFFRIKLKVHDPSNFRLVIDYQSYNFNLD